MRYFILCIVIAIGFNAFTQTNYQVVFQDSSRKAPNIVRIKDIDIPLNDIPINEGYRVSKKSDNINSQKRFFASYNKSRIALITPWDAEETPDSTIEMYNNQGNLIWKTYKSLHSPVKGLISDKGNSIFIWYNNIQEVTALTMYDNKGKILFDDDSIYWFLSDQNNEIVYYMKDQISINKSSNNILYCYSNKTKKSWNKSFPTSRPFTLLAVSGNGEYVLCGTGTELYNIDSDGNIMWQKEYSDGSSLHRLSFESSFAIRLNNAHFWELLDKKGNVIFRKEVENIGKYTILPRDACFVKNDDKIIAVTSSIERKKSIIAFYDLKGKLLGYTFVNQEGNCFIELMPDNIYQIYFNNRLVSEYKKIW